MISPCDKCPKQGCGPYHDKCIEYLKFKQSVKDDKYDIQARFGFNRNWEKLSKTCAKYKEKYHTGG